MYVISRTWVFLKRLTHFLEKINKVRHMLYLKVCEKKLWVWCIKVIATFQLDKWWHAKLN